MSSKRGESMLFCAIALMRAKVVSVAGCSGAAERREGGGGAMAR